jgi:predicted secreted protein
MKLASILAIYPLFWALSLFLVLPFRLRSGTGPDEIVPGQADGAPPRFSFARTAVWTTVVSAVIFGLYYANYVNGWIGPEAIDFFTPRT